MLRLREIFDQLESHAHRTGFFDRVHTHEPKSAPGDGLTCVFWLDSIGATARASGLDVTSAVVRVEVRIYTKAFSEPADEVDIGLGEAVAGLMGAYNEDFTLDDEVRNIDLFGMEGEQMTARFGYLSVDQTMYRVATFTLPLIINDVWNQEA